jgi:vacuolar-type H+-ATPase subunit D/Vma8
LAELQQYLQRETQRITGYFADLRAELTDRQLRAAAKGEDVAAFEAQRSALEREEQTQLADLRHKLALRVQIRLLNVLHVIQPKLRIRVQLVPPQGISGEIEVVFDPALQKVEATVCPECARPTLALALKRSGQVVCPACAAASLVLRKGKSS